MSLLDAFYGSFLNKGRRPYKPGTIVDRADGKWIKTEDGWERYKGEGSSTPAKADAKDEQSERPKKTAKRKKRKKRSKSGIKIPEGSKRKSTKASRWIIRDGEPIPAFGKETDEEAISKWDELNAGKPMTPAPELANRYEPYIQGNGKYDLDALFSKFGTESERKDGSIITKLEVSPGVFVSKDDLVSMEPNLEGVHDFTHAYTKKVRTRNKKTGELEEREQRITVLPDKISQINREGRWQRIRAHADKLDNMPEDVTPLLDSDDPTERAYALAIRLMSDHAIRVSGGKSGGKKTYGATTVLAKHLKERKDGTHLKFLGKDQEKFDLLLSDDVAAVLKDLAQDREPDEPLLDITERHVRRMINEDYPDTGIHPHDIRRFRATQEAIRSLANVPPPKKGESYKDVQKRLDKAFTKVAKLLGHKNPQKPDLARKTYSDPMLEKLWATGELQRMRDMYMKRTEKAWTFIKDNDEIELSDDVVNNIMQDMIDQMGFIYPNAASFDEEDIQEDKNNGKK